MHTNPIVQSTHTMTAHALVCNRIIVNEKKKCKIFLAKRKTIRLTGYTYYAMFGQFLTNQEEREGEGECCCAKHYAMSVTAGEKWVCKLRPLHWTQVHRISTCVLFHCASNFTNTKLLIHMHRICRATEQSQIHYPGVEIHMSWRHTCKKKKKKS